MTRRERLEARLEKRAEWAASRDRKSAAGFERARAIADRIPLGQPILVGHHSEKRHRRDIGRIDAGMRAGCESAAMASHHRSKADGIERQLETSIFSDDEDAPERIAERIADLEATRARWKAQNAAFRKGDEAFAAAMGCSVEDAARGRAKIMADYSWCRQPHPSYRLSNLGGNISRLRKRLVDVRARAERTERAEAAGGVTIDRALGLDWCTVTFAEKPDRKVIEELKAAGFRWGGGSWHGPTSKLPEGLKGGLA